VVQKLCICFLTPALQQCAVLTAALQQCALLTAALQQCAVLTGALQQCAVLTPALQQCAVQYPIANVLHAALSSVINLAKRNLLRFPQIDLPTVYVRSYIKNIAF
jgi:hypothetical protein